MADHQHISIALREVITDLVRRALEEGNAPPSDVVGDLLVHIDYDACAYCDGPIIMGPVPLHVYSATNSCPTQRRWVAAVGPVIDELLSSGLLPVETLAQVVAGERLSYDPEDMSIEVHGGAITLEVTHD